MPEWKNIPVKPDTYNAILALGRKGDTFDDVLKGLLRLLKEKKGRAEAICPENRSAGNAGDRQG